MIISIETGRVLLSIVDNKSDQSMSISYLEHYLMPFDETPTPTELSRKLLATVEEALVDFGKSAQARSHVDIELLFLLGSPWHVSWSDTIHISKDKPFKVSAREIEEAVNSTFRSSHNGFTIISRHIMGYKMNGYSMGDPMGKITSSLDMHAYVESAPEAVITSLSSVIRKHLPHISMSFTTASFAAVEAVKHYSNMKDMILILPEYDVTDVILVKNGMIQSMASLPWGGASMARDLFGKVSSGIEEAFAKSNRLLSGELDTKEVERVTKLSQDIRSKLVSDFRNILWKMNESLLLPGDCVVVGDNIAAHFIAKWLDDEDYSEQTYTLNGLKISLLSGKDLASLLAIDIGNMVKVPFSTVSGSIIGKRFDSESK